MDNICEFCNKTFSSSSNLKIHIKTSKKCIELRKTIIPINSIEILKFTCEFCDKEFSQKNNLLRHQDNCKKKEKNEIMKENITKSELEDENHTLKEELKVLKEKQIKHEYELSLKDEQLKYALKSLEKKEQEYIELLNSFKSIKVGGKSTTNNTTNNTTVNNYNVQFDKMVEKLLIFSPENIKNSIKNINGHDLVYLNNFDGEKNFSAEFVKCIKDLTFCTDTSRGSLIVKKEDGNADKITSESFVLKCLEDGKQECIQKINLGIQFLENEYDAGEADPINSTISLDDFVKCRYKLLSLRDHIRQNGPNEVITTLSNVVAKNVEQLSSKQNKTKSKELIK
jgi:hypothetical protein